MGGLNHLFTHGYNQKLSGDLGFIVTMVPQAVFDVAIKDARFKANCENSRIRPVPYFPFGAK